MNLKTRPIDNKMPQKIHPVRSISIEPIEYNGQTIDSLSISGHPFGTIESLHQRIKDELGTLAYQGSNDLILDEQTQNDLLSEAKAHGAIMGFCRELLLHTYKNPNSKLKAEFVKESIIHLDEIRSIYRILYNQTNNRSTQETTRHQLESTEPLLKSFLADYALVTLGNFKWRYQLLNESLELYERIKQTSFLLDTSKNEDIDEASERIKRNIEQIEKVKNETGFKADSSLHPESLQAQMNIAVQNEEFELAATLRDKIFAIDIQVCLDTDSHFFKYILKELMIERGSEGLSIYVPQIDEFDELITIELHRTNKETHNLEFVLMEEGRKKLIEVCNPAMTSRVLDLIHSDEYVMLFGRFNTDLL